jgi:hypothetical protein
LILCLGRRIRQAGHLCIVPLHWPWNGIR